MLVSPVRDDRDMEALIAELDKKDFIHSKSKLNAALSAINQVQETDLQETVNEALDHHDVRIDSWDLSQWEEALDEWDDSVWLRASFGNTEDVIVQINKSGCFWYVWHPSYVFVRSTKSLSYQ